MSFDPITLAMAKPKVIDLDEYGIGVAILYLFANGGGTQTLENVGQFWSDISTDKELRLEMNYSEWRFVIDQCARMMEPGFGAVQLSYGFLVTDEEGTSYEIKVSIVRTATGGAYVTVKAT